jgi:hypothetical protein
MASEETNHFIGVELKEVEPEIDLLIDQDVFLQLRIMRSNKKKVISRSDYSYFQFLGDVGALYSTLEIIFNFALITIL